MIAELDCSALGINDAGEVTCLRWSDLTPADRCNDRSHCTDDAGAIVQSLAGMAKRRPRWRGGCRQAIGGPEEENGRPEVASWSAVLRTYARECWISVSLPPPDRHRRMLSVDVGVLAVPQSRAFLTDRLMTPRCRNFGVGLSWGQFSPNLVTSLIPYGI
jgi:hypothetical protein